MSEQSLSTDDIIRPKLLRTEAIDVSLFDTSRFQPRQLIYKLLDKEQDEDVLQSMKKVGLLHPIAAFKKDSRFELMWGHRRLEAAKRLGWDKIECDVYETTNDLSLWYFVGEENFVRQQVRPYEKGKYFLYYKNFGMNVSAVSRMFHKPASTIRLWIEDASSWDELMTGLAPQQMEAFVGRVSIRSEKALKRLIEINGSDDDLKRAISMVIEGQNDDDIEEYVEAAINALTKRGLKSKSSLSIEAKKGMRPADLEKEVNSLISKIENAESIDDSHELITPLRQTIQVLANTEREHQAQINEYQKILKGVKSIKVKNVRFKVAHILERDKRIGHCWHETPDGKKVCLNFEL